MRYEIIETQISAETTLENDKYSVLISLAVKDNNDLIPNFTKWITVESHQSKTGYEVDLQRETAINNYIAELNA
jgi:hypothetical protein